MTFVVGFIVRRRRYGRLPRGKVGLPPIVAVEWANGAGGWTPERRRAFLFTTTAGHTHDDVRGNLGGRAWAKGHLRVLRDRRDLRGWHVGIVRVVAKS